MNLLWAFDFKANDLDKRDPHIPIKYTDFISVSSCQKYKFKP